MNGVTLAMTSVRADATPAAVAPEKIIRQADALSAAARADVATTGSRRRLMPANVILAADSYGVE